MTLLREQQQVVELRRAGWRDSHAVWRWNNSAAARAVSRRTGSIPIAAHQEWYSERLCAPGHYMWIATADGRDVGVVRIDARGDGAGTVSMVIDHTARGRGIGQQALNIACQRLEALLPGVVLEAWILSKNTGSERCFQRCGFEPWRSTTRGVRLFNIYRRETR